MTFLPQTLPAPAPALADPLGDTTFIGDSHDSPFDSSPRNDSGRGACLIAHNDATRPSSHEPARESGGELDHRLQTTDHSEPQDFRSLPPCGGAAYPLRRELPGSPSAGFYSGGQTEGEPQPAQPAVRDEWRIAEANRRLAILTTHRALLASGSTAPEAARKVGESIATLWRWNKRFRAEGYEGLIPSTDKCGRKSMLAKLGLTQDEIDRVRGINLDTQSNTTAWRLYAQSDECREDVARVILDPTKSSKHSLPPSLRRATKVNRNHQLAHRGPRALALGGIWQPRKLDILPGDIFCSDDTTPIWAWWVPWVQCEEYPFGVKLLQGQFLPIIDVASQCIINFVLIAREQSSYRAADIWRLFGHTFETIGLPRLGWQLERGSWEANIIRGVEVEYEQAGVSLSRRVGGLRQLPSNPLPWHRERMDGAEFPKNLQTWTSYLPKTKSIEAAFDRMQTLEGTIWGCLGRDQMRKPFEKAKQVYEACRRGTMDPRKHFLSHVEMVNKLRERLDFLNNEPMEGEVFSGIPRLHWENAIRDNPLYRLPDDQRWLYRRDWKQVTITQGWARIRLTDEALHKRYSLFYGNGRLFESLEGQDVIVYYDREHYEEPAEIILARTGEYLGQAEYVERKGSFLGGDKTGHELRKEWKDAVLASYGTIVKHAPSRQLPAEIAARRATIDQPTSSRSRGNEALTKKPFEPKTPTPAPARPAAAAAAITPEDLDLLGGPAPESNHSRPRGDYGVSMEDLDLL